jgi:dGTPase
VAGSRGRTESGPYIRSVQEPPPKGRSEAERDHDRVIYTSALQRLAGITQIAAPEAGLSIHNRLTHTLKVAQVARRLAKQIGLDADRQEVAAAAALAHDLGHPPFGHLGEVALNRRAKRWGGFEGNAQSFRIVTFLALRTDAYRGINLTRRTLDGILKYPWLRGRWGKKAKKWGAYETEREFLDFARSGRSGEEKSLEAAVMDWSDDVTYAVHDLEDFFRLGLIPLDRLGAADDIERRRFKESFSEPKSQGERLRKKFLDAELSADDLEKALRRLFTAPAAPFGLIAPYRGGRRDRTNLRYQTSFLIGRFVRGPKREGESLQVPQKQLAEVAVLKELAWFYVITDPSLSTIQRGQEKVITELHDIYIGAAGAGDEERQLFPLAQRELLGRVGTRKEAMRLATDFVAGLTEPMAYELHHRLTGVSSGSILDAAARASR